jgi:diguanylate cyclase
VRVDVDDFKVVNNTYGHDAGNQALRHLASIMKQKVRERDRIYRAGGDEFVILCSDYSKEEALGTMRRVAGELRRRLVRWVSEDSDVKEFLVTMSVGISECAGGEFLEACLNAADAAAYKSKEQGKDRITLAP